MIRKDGMASPVAASRQTRGLPSLASSCLRSSPVSAFNEPPAIRLRQPSADPDLLYSSTSILLSSVADLTNTLSPKALGLGLSLLPPASVTSVSGLNGLPFLQPSVKAGAHSATPPTTIEMLKPHQWRFDPHYSRKKGCPPAAKRFRDVLGLSDAPTYKPGQRSIDIRPPTLPSKQQVAQILLDSPPKLSVAGQALSHPPGLPMPISQQGYDPRHPAFSHASVIPPLSWSSVHSSSLAAQAAYVGHMAHTKAAALAMAGQTKQSVAARMNNAVQSMWPYRVQ